MVRTPLLKAKKRCNDVRALKVEIESFSSASEKSSENFLILVVKCMSEFRYMFELSQRRGSDRLAAGWCPVVPQVVPSGTQGSTFG